MLVSKHIFFGLIFVGFLYLIFPQIELIELSIIFLSSILIDVDHYFYYVYKKKNWNLKRAHKWHINEFKKFLSLSWKQRNKTPTRFSLLHGIETLLFVFLLSFINQYFLFVFINY